MNGSLWHKTAGASISREALDQYELSNVGPRPMRVDHFTSAASHDLLRDDVPEQDLGQGGDVLQQAGQGIARDLGEGLVSWGKYGERSQVVDGLLCQSGSCDGGDQGGEPRV